MRLSSCPSCARLIQTGTGCPFCGAPGVPTVPAPRAAALLLSVPLLAAACTETKKSEPPPEPAYGVPEVIDPAPPDAPNSQEPAPKNGAQADPPAPAEPQNEIYGTPDMMGGKDDAPEPK